MFTRAAHAAQRSRNPFQRTEGMPIPPAGAAGHGELLTAYAEGVQALDGYSHAILLDAFRRAGLLCLRVVPLLDQVAHGVCSARAIRLG